MFTVSVDPADTGVRLIRRIDPQIAGQHATVSVGGLDHYAHALHQRQRLVLARPGGGR